MRFLKQLLLLVCLGLGSLAVQAGSVDINTADAETLATAIHGVGLEKAAEIVKYREQHGAFKSVEELKNVKGIGDKILEENKDGLVAGVEEE